MKLGNKSKASEAIHAMLKLNPDDAELYTQLEATLEDPSPENLLSHYLELEKSYPRSTAVRFRILELLDVASPEWASRAAGELQKGFRKGVPSLFTSIEKLWASNPAKKTWIKAAVATYAAELEKSGRFPGSEEQEPPTAFPWALLFLALLLDSDGDQSEALATIDRAIEHTPTLVDLHMVRGRILKHSGRLSDASEALETARGMDLQDRFVNTKSAKYLLRLGEYAKAEDVVRLFIKDGDVKDLVELQVIWFATEAAESWARKGEWGKAVGRWYQIEKVGLHRRARDGRLTARSWNSTFRTFSRTSLITTNIA